MNFDEFLSQLAVLENIIDQNSDCAVVCSGDFNADIARDCKSHSRLLNSYRDHSIMYYVILVNVSQS